jgi:hypothetical protein
MNRVGGPIETANLAVFLASEESSLSTGAEFIADGRKRLPLLPCAWDHGRSINGETIAIDGGSLTRGYPALLTGYDRCQTLHERPNRRANLSASIDSLELRRVEGASFEGLVALSTLLFVRGDLLGRIADYDRARSVRAQAALLGLSSTVAVVGGI